MIVSVASDWLTELSMVEWEIRINKRRSKRSKYLDTRGSRQRSRHSD